ncbi:MAG: hypothetical protein RR495_02645, partial [Anaerovoracaceae bacterium]
MNKTSRNKKKGRILSIVLTVAMVLSMMPSLAFAAPPVTLPHENHKVCGAIGDCTHTGESHTGTITYKPLTADGGVLSGDYYLTENVTLTTNITVNGTGKLNLCLNGYALKGTASSAVFTVEAGGTLNICDCKPTEGSHKFTKDEDGKYVLGGSGTEVPPITGGVITGGNRSAGGGIYNSGTTTISGGTIIGNKATHGGGIHNSLGGTTTITGGTIKGNTAQDGGGIYNDGETTINGGTITGNTAKDVGGIFNAGKITISGGTITGNTAKMGGGIYNSSGGTTTINGGTITGNTAIDKSGAGVNDSINGGGIFNDGEITINGGTIKENTATNAGGGIFNDGKTTINGGTIEKNTAVAGGGIFNNGNSKVIIARGAITGNTASSDGGGIHNNNGTTTITGGTITGNTAPIGGGVYNRSGEQLNLQGQVEINGNTKLDKTTPSNLFLGGNDLKITGDLTNDTKIGVSGG